MPWINHPATQDGPVSVQRWLAFKIGEWLGYWARRLEHYGLYGDSRDDIPF